MHRGTTGEIPTPGKAYGPRIGLVNPLPRALAHYQAELTCVLEAVGSTVVVLSSTSIEQVDRTGSRAESVGTLLRESRSMRRHLAVDHVLILWPALGFLDLPRWRALGTGASVIFHDPQPLRPQFGLGNTSAWLGRALRGKASVITHSQQARQVLLDLGFSHCRELPHPMLPPSSAWVGGRRVVVAGQYKPARDLSLLHRLGPMLRRQGFEPVICGPGWPPVLGWRVDARFVPEEEFAELVRTAGCLLLPYDKVFQSGIAVRAAEAGVPVVGPRASNLPALFGRDWPGLIEGGSDMKHWLTAIERVTALGGSSVVAHADAAFQEVLRAWGGYVRGLHA